MEIQSLVKEIIKDDKTKQYLKEAVAEKIADHAVDCNYEEFKPDILSALQEEYKRLVNEYLKDYIEESSIRSTIERTLREMTKEEIINLLKDK